MMKKKWVPEQWYRTEIILIGTYIKGEEGRIWKVRLTASKILRFFQVMEIRAK